MHPLVLGFRYKKIDDKNIRDTLEVDRHDHNGRKSDSHVIKPSTRAVLIPVTTTEKNLLAGKSKKDGQTRHPGVDGHPSEIFRRSKATLLD